MRQLIRAFPLVTAILALAAAPAAAQTARPPSDPEALGRGWTALAAGRVDDAVALATGILRRNPRSHAAIGLQIEALSSTPKPLTALDAYEAWLPAAGREVEDRGLLEPIARGLLRTMATDPDPAVRTAALRALADLGDAAAAQALKTRSTEGDQTATIALAAGGDAGAVANLQAMVSAGTGRDYSSAIDSLAERGDVSIGLLGALAKDRVPMNRAAAALAAATSRDPAAAQLLESLNDDQDPLVRRSLTLARAKRGDRQALAEAQAMLQSEVPDLRLMAAAALKSNLPVEAVEAVRPLLTNQDGLTRFKAAALVGPSDPTAVQSVLDNGLASPNPLIQQEAARIATTVLPTDLALLRRLLRHADRTIVAAAASAVVRR